MIILKKGTDEVKTIAVNSATNSLDNSLNEYSKLTPKNSVITAARNECVAANNAFATMKNNNNTDYNEKTAFASDDPLLYADIPAITAVPQNDWANAQTLAKQASNAFTTADVIDISQSLSGYTKTLSLSTTASDYNITNEVGNTNDKINAVTANNVFSYQSVESLNNLPAVPQYLPTGYIKMPSGMNDSGESTNGSILRVMFKDGYSLAPTTTNERWECSLPIWSNDDEEEIPKTIYFFDGSVYKSINIENGRVFLKDSNHGCYYKATYLRSGERVSTSTSNSNYQKVFFQPGACIDFIVRDDDKLYILPGQTVLELKCIPMPNETNNFTGYVTVRYITTSSGIHVEVEGHNIKPECFSANTTLTSFFTANTFKATPTSSILSEWRVNLYTNSNSLLSDQRGNWGTNAANTIQYKYDSVLPTVYTGLYGSGDFE